MLIQGYTTIDSYYHKTDVLINYESIPKYIGMLSGICSQLLLLLSRYEVSA